MTNDINPQRMMTTLPIEEITFDLIKEFCDLQIEEGLDLDYKSGWPKYLDRVMCAFANTQGGLVLMGVEENGKTKKPISPPTGLEGDSESFIGAILNVAFDGIYPPITPEIQVCQLPNEKKSIVIVIRVHPSKLTHSTDRRSRIYVRVADSKRGYDLASISDLQWLWNQREATIKLKEALLRDAQDHSDSEAISWNDDESKKAWKTSPILRFQATLTYPSLSISMNSRKLLELANSIELVKSPWPYMRRTIPHRLGIWRSIQNGVAVTERGEKPSQQFVELGNHGLVYLATEVHTEQYRFGPDFPVVSPYRILSDLAMMLSYVASFYGALEWRYPVELKAELSRVKGVGIALDVNTHDGFSLPSLDSEVIILEDEIFTNEIEANCENWELEATKKLLWSFGVGWNEKDADAWLNRLKTG